MKSTKVVPSTVSMWAPEALATLKQMLIDSDDRHLSDVGLAAYRSVRPLSRTEIAMTDVFDRSTVLMAGLDWADCIYRRRRAPDPGEAIPGRLDEILVRLERLGRR